MSRHWNSANIFVIGETLILGLLQFVTFTLLLRMIDHTLLGIWILINVLLGFARVTDVWSQGLSGFVAEANAANDDRRARGFVETAVLMGMFGYACAALVGGFFLFVYADWLSDGTNPELVREILPFMGLSFWLSSVAGTFQLGLLGFLRPGLKVLQTVGSAAVLLLLSIILVPQFGLWGVIFAQIGQATFSVCFGIIAYRLAIVGTLGWTGWRRDCLHESVHFGSKMTIVAILQMALEPLIRILTKEFGGLSAVTLVDLAARLVALGRSILTSVGQILVPSFAVLRSSEDSERRGKLLKKVQVEFVLIGTLGFSVLVAAGPLTAAIILGYQSLTFMIALAALSTGWFANAVASPSFFLCLGDRRFAPLLVNHLIMTGGAATLGYGGGLALGINGMLTGVALALVLSGIQLVLATRPELGSQSYGKLGSNSLRVLLVPISAVMGLWIFTPTIYDEGAQSSNLGMIIPIAITLLIGLIVLPLRQMVKFLFY